MLLLILVGFIAFAVKNLERVTQTLKDAFALMKISVEYVKEVQKVSEILYDPGEIEKFVKLRVEAATSEIRAEADCRTRSENSIAFLSRERLTGL